MAMTVSNMDSNTDSNVLDGPIIKESIDLGSEYRQIQTNMLHSRIHSLDFSVFHKNFFFYRRINFFFINNN